MSLMPCSNTTALDQYERAQLQRDIEADAEAAREDAYVSDNIARLTIQAVSDLIDEDERFKDALCEYIARVSQSRDWSYKQNLRAAIDAALRREFQKEQA